jgi:hypothetical protein
MKTRYLLELQVRMMEFNLKFALLELEKFNALENQHFDTASIIRQKGMILKNELNDFKKSELQKISAFSKPEIVKFFS